VASFILIATIGGLAVLYVVLVWFVPRLTRPDLYFAVTVAGGFRNTPESTSILRRYHAELITVSVAVFTAGAAGVLWLGVGFVPVGFYALLAASFIPFYRARQRVLPHSVSPTTIREAELAAGNQILPGGWVVASGPFIIVAASAAHLWIHRASSVERGAGSWNAAHSRGLLAHNYPIVYVVATGGILAALTLILYGTTHWVRPIHATGPKAARELRFRRTASGLLLITEYFISVQSSLAALLGGRHASVAYRFGTVLVPALFLFFIFAAVLVLARLGQGGSAVPEPNETTPDVAGPPIGDRMNDSYWKLGIVYFNPDDPSVVVERRFGVGYTLNFARPVTWIIMSLLAGSAFVPIIAGRLLR
jgi:uncharacterized membrane protein